MKLVKNPFGGNFGGIDDAFLPIKGVFFTVKTRPFCNKSV